jgi:hypothetical protein
MNIKLTDYVDPMLGAEAPANCLTEPYLPYSMYRRF